MARNYLLITTARLQPAEPPPVRDDAYLEYWGEVYLANRGLRAIGITFEVFLQAPELFLDSATHHILVPLPEGFKFYPLLPAQRALREQLDAFAAGQLALGFEEAA